MTIPRIMLPFLRKPSLLLANTAMRIRPRNAEITGAPMLAQEA